MDREKVSSAKILFRSFFMTFPSMYQEEIGRLLMENHGSLTYYPKIESDCRVFSEIYTTWIVKLVTQVTSGHEQPDSV